MSNGMKCWTTVLVGVFVIIAIQQLLLPSEWRLLFGCVAGGMWGFIGMSFALRRWPF